MNSSTLRLTHEQRLVIRDDSSAFVTACPGAGKTLIMAERARRLFQRLPSGRGVAFMSFTHGAVFELETRLRRERLLPTPVFPSFMDTFDSFVWRFLVAPFGIPRSNVRPRLVPDLPHILVAPPHRAHKLPLSCFCRKTGTIHDQEAKEKGFNTSTKPRTLIRAYEAAAAGLRTRLRERGHLGFDDARDLALERLTDGTFSRRLADALRSRFFEVIVDEAQDCNPEDLAIVAWLIDLGIPVKVVCDPNQSIYGFRGGVTDELKGFAARFTAEKRMRLSGNFRSTTNICKAIAPLRPMTERGTPDDALGPWRDESRSVRILSYQGKVTGAIGETYQSLLRETDIEVASSPIVSGTWAIAATAAGQPPAPKKRDRCIRLAEAVVGFRVAAGFDAMKSALEDIHRILLEIEGRLAEVSYHQYLADNDVEDASWRSKVISVVQELDPDKYLGARAWHKAAKDSLASRLTLKAGRSISQELKWSAELETALSMAPHGRAAARTIHSVKGMEFPSVCVVTTTSRLKGILDFLTKGWPSKMAEEARKLYVAASRAQRLLVIAAPKSQAQRLSHHLSSQGAAVTTGSL